MPRLVERIGLAVLHRLQPEAAHDLALRALRLGLVPLPEPRARPRLATRLAGMALANPLGLAAGYDKNAVALAALDRVGFGFLEVGAATPRPQPGNPQPRLFRLSEDRAVINRFGFNNDGAEVIAARLAAQAAQDSAKRGARRTPTGLNLGANKDSTDRPADFARVLKLCGAYVDFATINVSSPNTEKLRDLQGPVALRALLTQVIEARADLPRPIPLFLKIAPDLGTDEIAQIAEIALAAGIDGLIATNTTLSREGLTSPFRHEAGGMSGAPLFERSTRVLAQLAQAVGRRIPIIGVGGVSGPDQAYAKLLAGATAVQLYSGLVWGGLSLVDDILDGLEERLARDGHDSPAQAVGRDIGAWL